MRQEKFVLSPDGRHFKFPPGGKAERWIPAKYKWENVTIPDGEIVTVWRSESSALQATCARRLHSEAKRVEKRNPPKRFVRTVGGEVVEQVG